MALYDGGVLETYQVEAYGTNIIWKLDTGEVWEGARYDPTEETMTLPADERETHA